MGVNRSTIHRDLPDLDSLCNVYEEADGRLVIDRASLPVNVPFTLHEALAVHLAARLLATRMDRQNPHAASALRKLGQALHRLAPRISRHLGQAADVMDGDTQRHDPHYLQTLETLTLAWAEGWQVELWYRRDPEMLAHQYRFSTYFIEAYAIGQSAYVIGRREPDGSMRTLKIDRIERIELTMETYAIPAEFDAERLLEDAWGIWYSEKEPVEVLLKFHPRVARRVKETRWHASEMVEEQPDGSLVWRARIAEPQEMLPWIRGWGADVEVLGPESLRQLLREEVSKLGMIYLSDETQKGRPYA
jgi:predicted DNA-binding transcriptional regulator YafY